tara:strand:+ start:340 stop:894 length:555 start_codon:yes stop_codon:yes gene_type:complete
MALISTKAATVTSVPRSSLPAGSVVQTVQGVMHGAATFTSASMTDISSDLNLTITPTSASNKLLLTGFITLSTQTDACANIFLSVNGVNVGYNNSANGNTAAHTGLNYHYLSGKGEPNWYESWGCPINWLTGAIGTTSAIVCKPRINNSDDSGVTIYVNRSRRDAGSSWTARYVSTFTVQEIKV